MIKVRARVAAHVGVSFFSQEAKIVIRQSVNLETGGSVVRPLRSRIRIALARGGGGSG